MTGTSAGGGDLEIAVIGMACRFPGAASVEAFWENLRNGVESISFFSDEELRDSGIAPEVLQHPAYVKAAGILDEPEHFDARFFGFTAREAQTLDPQHRLFLELAWEALERAGHDPHRYRGSIGVFAGSSGSAHFWKLVTNPRLRESVSGLQALLSTDRDFLATRIAYKLNLTGPAVTVQTACSTSLSAVHLACQSLLAGECDMALAGGVSVPVPQKVGYVHEPDGILSRDGHCRAFDAEASGTVRGSGSGIVVLKRLSDALRDGDRIEVVIKGWAMNNDGAQRVGFTAPGVEGQVRVVRLAQAMAGVEPDSIGYVEAHGTGTALGDPIEIAALAQVFGAATQRRAYCAVGSVKTNIGHLDAAAGVAALMKTALMLSHGELVSSLHFRDPNPRIDFANSPFYVNTRTAEWPVNGGPRRAGVSSLGMGGTNVHVVLEEAPPPPRRSPIAGPQALLVSARTEAALERATDNLAQHLERHPELDLADVAFTLRTGRHAFRHRRAVVCQDLAEGARALGRRDATRVSTGEAPEEGRPVAFMFTGQGAQYAGMGRGLYEAEPVFRAEVDACCERLQPLLDLDLRLLLHPDPACLASAAERLSETRFTQPALFVVEHALSRLWMSWGVVPEAMIGHSIGEYVAACVAGVMTRDEALAAVAERGRLMQACPRGAMTAVALSAEGAQPFLESGLDLCVVNGPDACVIGGPVDAVERLEARLVEREVVHTRLATSHAFHSALMQPAVAALAARMSELSLRAPRIPFVSNVTGTWITAEQATDPVYWAEHLRQTVRFSEGLGELLRAPERVLLEVGPGTTLVSLAKRRLPADSPARAIASMRHHRQPDPDHLFLLQAAARAWTAGVVVDPSRPDPRAHRRRVPLPTYPFERERYGLGPSGPAAAGAELALRKKELADWFYLPSWKRTPPLGPVRPAAMTARAPWLVFADECGVGAALGRRLSELGQRVVVVRAESRYARLDASSFSLDPAEAAHYEALIAELRAEDSAPGQVVHLWGITAKDAPPRSLERSQDLGFYSLLYLAQALGNQSVGSELAVAVVTSGMQEVSGEGLAHPEKALALGPCKAIPAEYPWIRCRSIDIVEPGPDAWPPSASERLLAEVAAFTAEPVVALRGIDRWVPTFEAARLAPTEGLPAHLRAEGAYLITGGLGGIGLELAECLSRTVHARLALVGRTGLPPRDEWDDWLASRDAADAARRKIEKVRALEALGSEVLVLKADVTRRAEMDEVLRTAEERFGRIDGVIHSAGEPAGGVIQLKTREAAHGVLAPKVEGALILNDLLATRSPDFIMYCSSLASVVSGAGQVDYVAANAFLDALARSNTSGGGPFTVSVDWDTWSEVGMAVETVAAGHRADGRLALEKGMLSAEGVEAFVRILDHGLPHVVTSTLDLESRMRAAQAVPSAPEANQAALARHPRPNIGAVFVPPEDPIEKQVAAIWGELLGIDPIGLDDNFFELGGSSLVAVHLMGRLKRTHGVEVPVAKLFEAPTVRALGRVIRGVGAERELDRSRDRGQLRRQSLRGQRRTSDAAVE